MIMDRFEMVSFILPETQKRHKKIAEMFKFTMHDGRWYDDLSKDVLANGLYSNDNVKLYFFEGIMMLEIINDCK